MDKSVDQPQPVSEQPVTEPGLSQDNPHMPKYLAVTSIALAVIVGYLVLANFQHWFPFGSQRMAVSTPTPTLTGTTTPTPTTINVAADWKTYSNNQYGFEFQYPNNWALDHSLKVWDNTINVLGGSDGGVELSIYSNESEYPLTLEDWVKNRSLYRKYIIQNIMISGVNAVKETFTDGLSNQLRVHIPVNNIHSFIVSFEAGGSDIKILDQILSTFKFIEPQAQKNATTLDVATWKTYKSAEYGFEFRYPPEFNFDSSQSPVLFWGLPLGSISIKVLNKNLDPSNITLLGEKVNPIILKVGDRNGYQTKYIDAGWDFISVETALDNQTLALGFSSHISEIADENLGKSLTENDPLLNKILSTFKFTK